jgi:hypothetical protein
VGLPAVRLDDKPLGGPEEVDAAPEDPLLGRRARERVPVADGQEPILEATLRGKEVVDPLPEPPRRPAAER